MATDTFMVFFPNTGSPLTSESQIDFGSGLKSADPFNSSLTNKNFFEVQDWSYDIEQTLNLGSQSAGAGAGKIQFNPLSITRRVDVISNKLYLMACRGEAFKYVDVLVRKASGGESQPGGTFLGLRFGLVAVKTQSLSHDDEAVSETVTFEYGSLQVAYAQQDPKGTLGTPNTTGWDRVRNVQVNG